MTADAGEVDGCISNAPTHERDFANEDEHDCATKREQPENRVPNRAAF